MNAHCRNPACGRQNNWDVRGLCRRCYDHWRKTGELCTKDQMRRRAPGDPVRICKRCRQAEVRCRGLCARCYWYQAGTGRPRPRHLWEQKCTVCGKPGRYRSGRCRACQTYHRVNGRDRSSDLIRRRAPLGWCECGELAAHKITVPVGEGSRTETYGLCDMCYAEEMR